MKNSASFTLIRADANKWVPELLGELHTVGDKRRINVIKASHARTPKDAKGVSAAVTQYTKEYLRRVYESHKLLEDETKDLIHAHNLNSVGNHRAGRDYVSRAIHDLTQEARTLSRVGRRMLVKAYLLKASSNHALSDYEASRRDAQTANRIAKRRKYPDLQLHSSIAVDEALRMEHLISLDFQKWRVLVSPFSWLITLRFLIDAFGGLIKFRQLDDQYFQAKFAYLDHLVRLGAIFQGQLLYWIPGPVREKIYKHSLGWYWRLVATQSTEIGFARGLGYSMRYRERRGSNIPPGLNLDSAKLFDLLNERSGLAIHLRDKGERILESAKGMSKGSQSKSIEKAVSLFEESLAIAREVENYSLVIKNMVLIKRAKPKTQFSAEAVEEVLNNIQGRAYHNVASHLINWLSN